MPSLLGAIVDSVSQICQNAAAAKAPEEGGVGDKQLLTLPFHDRFAALGAGVPVAVRKSARVPTPSVQLRSLPDHAGRRGAGSRAAPAAPGSTGVPSTRATAGGGAAGASRDRGPTRRHHWDSPHREGGAAAQRSTSGTSSSGTGN